MIADRSLPRDRRRLGFGLIEMAVAGVLVAVAMTATVQVVGWIALERRAVGRRERAVVEASNVLERVVARPWDRLTAEAVGEVRMDEASGRSLPGASLEIKVRSLDDAPARKQVTVEIRWLDRSGRLEAPVSLVTWIYRRAEVSR